MKKFLTNKIFIVCAGFVVLTLGATLLFFLGDMYGLKHLTIRQVTTTQMASAMREDRFWSTYRENTLLFNGTITSMDRHFPNTKVELKTSDKYSVSCMLENERKSLKVGDTLKFESETYQAARQPSGVLLHKCIIL